MFGAKCYAEGYHMLVFRLAAKFAPMSVIAILLAAAHVAASDLEMPRGSGQIHTQVQARGAASDVMRDSASLETAAPYRSRWTKHALRIRWTIPG